VSPPAAPDLEEPEVLTLRVDDMLARPNILQEIGLASHVALFLAGTHPCFNRSR
jgi:hypothetical protein